jgi:hypothetical protein
MRGMATQSDVCVGWRPRYPPGGVSSAQMVRSTGSEFRVIVRPESSTEEAPDESRGSSALWHGRAPPGGRRGSTALHTPGGAPSARRGSSDGRERDLPAAIRSRSSTRHEQGWTVEQLSAQSKPT